MRNDYTFVIRTDPGIHSPDLISEVLSNLKGVEVVAVLPGVIPQLDEPVEDGDDSVLADHDPAADDGDTD